MKAEGKASVSALLSLVVGLLVTFLFIGYGVTEEVPVGTLNASVVMLENGKPLPRAFVTITKVDVTDLAAEEDWTTEHHFRADKEGRFHLRDLQAGSYKLEISSKAHKLQNYWLKINEGKVTVESLSAKPDDPYLEMYASQRIFLPSETPKIQLKGFTAGDELRAGVYRLDFDKVIKEGGMYNALAPLARPQQNKPSNPAAMGALVNSFDYQIKSKDAEGVFTDRLPVPQLSEGLYWIQCDVGKLSKGTWLSVTKIALVVKHANDHVAAFVTSLDSGDPVPGAAVGFATSSGVIASTQTSQQGLASLDLPPKRDEQAAEVVVASSGNSKALVDFRRASYSEDDSGDDTGDGGGADAQTRIYTYTDRPIYRPGDLVQYKGIVRRLVGSDYVLPKGQNVTVEMQDSSGTILDTKNLSVTQMGTFAGSYQFSQDALPDNYELVAHYGKAVETKDVGVAAYRKPTFSIDVHPEKKTYIRGETATMLVDSKYYYGAPVVGADVTATITRSPTWDWQDYDDSEEDFEQDYGDEVPEMYPGQQLTSYGGEQTQELHATTDGNGRAIIRFPTIGANEDQEAETDFEYTVSVAVKDQSDKSFEGEGTVNVLRSDEKLLLQTDRYVLTAGQIISITAAVKDQGSKGLQGVPVQVTSGFVHWSREGEEILSDKVIQNVVTGFDGTARPTVQPQGAGFYQITAAFTDDRGHSVTKRTEVYLYSDLSLREQADRSSIPDTDLSIMLDKKRYKAGDTAKALITCNNPGGSALVAVEGSQIYSAQTVKLAQKATVFEFQVKLDYSPNAFVSIAYVKDKHYAESSKQLLIDLGVRKLNVSVSPDKPVYHPGDTATYTITTKTADGKPTAADVSLGVVDESIYAIYDDQSDIVRAFYPKRQDGVQTDYSFPELYLGGGDKAPTNIQIRRNFKDTAFWRPDVETDSSGQAKVQVPLPDNLTSWRATVRAVTANTEVGQTTVSAIARKDLMIQLSAPTYVVDGDHQRLVAMVTNNTGAPADIHVSLDSQNATVEGNTNVVIHVGNEAMETVEYMMKPQHSGIADFTGKAWVGASGGASDGMELKVPVTPHARLSTNGYGGDTQNSKDIELTLQEAADKNAGKLEITVSPTIGTSLLGSLDALIAFPYGCVEQTTSRFLPAVLFDKATSELGLPKLKNSDKVPQIVQDSFARLQAMEHSDGAWGWWEYDSSDPHMTAYVLEALYRARQAGYETPTGIDLKKALDWAANYVKDPKSHLDLSWLGPAPTGAVPKPVQQEYQRRMEAEQRRLQADAAYLAYSLSLFGKHDEVKEFLSKVDPFRLDAGQAAFVALAANQLGAEEETLRRQALSRMLFLARTTNSTMDWPTEDWWGYETTARCFLALETIQPDNPAISKIVTLLMQKRNGDMWYSTRDTAAIMIAMVDYLKHTKELMFDANINVLLNGHQVRSLHFSKGAFPNEAMKIELPIGQLTTGQNDLRFQVQSGVCYYTVALKQYVVSSSMDPIDQGKALTVSRAYYKLSPQRMEDGTLRMMASKDPVAQYRSGDILQCEIKIHSDFGRDYLMVECPVPSGLHVTDREQPDTSAGETWNYWWSRTVILDDRVMLFSRNLSSGDSTMIYVLRAENPGTCAALPTTIYNMYDPSDTASSADSSIEVTQ